MRPWTNVPLLEPAIPLPNSWRPLGHPPLLVWIGSWAPEDAVSFLPLVARRCRYQQLRLLDLALQRSE